MEEKYYVKLGPKASIFFDQALKIKILKGDVKELNPSQYMSRSIQGALATGYLKKATEDEVMALVPAASKKKAKEEEVKEEKEPINVDELKAKFIEMAHDESIDKSKLKDYFKLDELRAITESYGFEVEEGDTKADLVEALLEELAN